VVAGAAPAPVRERVAWSGGAIVSNAQEATVAFLRRRLAAGAQLTEPQRAFLDAHRDLVLAEPLPARAPAAAAVAGTGTASALVGGKRRREAGGVGGAAVRAAPAAAVAPSVPLSARLGMSLDTLVGAHAQRRAPSGKKQQKRGGGGGGVRR